MKQCATAISLTARPTDSKPTKKLLLPFVPQLNQRREKSNEYGHYQKHQCNRAGKENRREAIEEHEMVLKRIKARDSVLAEAELRSHLSGVLRCVEQARQSHAEYFQSD